MLIAWDEPKRVANLDKHGMDFAALTPEFFEGARIEEAKAGRFLAVGEINGEIIVVVVFRPLGSEAISVISMRRASRNERSRTDD